MTDVAKPDVPARLDDLETRAAYQEQTAEELNEMITAQWKEIDRLNRRLAMLEARLQEAIESRVTSGLPEPPPPHY